MGAGRSRVAEDKAGRRSPQNCSEGRKLPAASCLLQSFHAAGVALRKFCHFDFGFCGRGVFQFSQLLQRFFPGFFVALGGDRCLRVLIEGQDILLQLRTELGEISLRQLIEQLGISIVGEAVFSSASLASSIAIAIGKTYVSGLGLFEQLAIVLHS